jgi:hypothetical protein
MLHTLTITNCLSQALQRKDQDIINAIRCVRSTRDHLTELRAHGWQKILHDTYAFCDLHDTTKLEMENTFIAPKRPRYKSRITNKHHYEVDCFNEVLDWLVPELDNRFNETSSELLVCSTSFNPRNSFQDFNVENIMTLAKLYPDDFDSGEVRDLSHQLCLYIADVRTDARFSNFHTIGDLSQKMAKTGKNIMWQLVYQLLKLILVLPIATTTVEMCFSGMKFVKTYLRNRIGDDHMNYILICYVEKEEMRKFSNDAIIHHFMEMRNRRFED